MISAHLAHKELVRRVLNDGARHDLAEVLGLARDLLRLTEREAVVVVRQLRLRRRQLVHLNLHLVAVSVLARRDTWQVEGVDRRSEQRGLRARNTATGSERALWDAQPRATTGAQPG